MAAKVLCIIQCRMTSSRLPRKAMLDLCGQPLLQRVIERCRHSQMVTELYVATSTDPEDELIEMVCGVHGVNCLRGDLLDVRSRYIDLTLRSSADLVVRVTADNPLTEPRYIDQLIESALQDPAVPYLIMNSRLIPVGSGSEVFRAEALLESAPRFAQPEDLEHVTPCIRKAYPVLELTPPDELRLEEESVSVDTFEDYLKVYKIFLRHAHDGPDILRSYIRERRALRTSGASEQRLT